MKTDEKVETRIWLIKRVIRYLREAEEDYERRHANDPDPLLSEDEVVLPEPFRVQLDGADMCEFLRICLERVLEGDPDPFRLNIGHRKHVLPRHKRTEAVIEAVRLIQEGMTPGKAAREVAKKFPASPRTIQNWMNDPDIRQWAEASVHAEQFEKQHPPPWDSEVSPLYLKEFFGKMAEVRDRMSRNRKG